jgi:hypothetical protein
LANPDTDSDVSAAVGQNDRIGVAAGTKEQPLDHNGIAAIIEDERFVITDIEARRQRVVHPLHPSERLDNLRMVGREIDLRSRRRQRDQSQTILGREPADETLQAGERASEHVRFSIVAIDGQHDEAAGTSIGVVRHIRIAGRCRSIACRRALGDELGADDTPRLTIDRHCEFRRAQIADGSAVAINDCDVDFHHFDARAEHRHLIGLGGELRNPSSARSDQHQYEDAAVQPAQALAHIAISS